MNRVFFPQETLNLLIDQKKVDLDGETLVILEHGARYQVAEAVRVIEEVTTGEDVRDLCGRVRTVESLAVDGAEVLGTSVLVDDSAYEGTLGMLGTPSGDGDERELAWLGALNELLSEDD